MTFQPTKLSLISVLSSENIFISSKLCFLSYFSSLRDLVLKKLGMSKSKSVKFDFAYSRFSTSIRSDGNIIFLVNLRFSFPLCVISPTFTIGGFLFAEIAADSVFFYSNVALSKSAEYLFPTSSDFVSVSFFSSVDSGFLFSVASGGFL